MKKRLLSLISLILALSMLLCGLIACNKDTPPAQEQPDGDTPPSAPAAEPYVSSKKYFTDEQLATIKTALEAGDSAFAPLDASMVPVVSMNIECLSGCSITSISIPAQKTLAADALGNFTFTVSVIGTTVDAMRSYLKSSTTLKINGTEHGLENNSYVCRYITVDLSDSPIVLKANETLALGDPEDTLLAACVLTENSTMASYMKKECGEPGMFIAGASDDLAYDRNLLCFDFTIQQTFESEAAYQAYVAAEKAAEDEFNAKVQALKDAGYKGKKLSIMGDSISTFEGTSNDSSVNSTIGIHNSFNTVNSNLSEWSLTWWGRLVSVLEMDLCVANAWSGAKCQGSSGKGNGKDSMLERADQLHRDNGTPNDKSDDVAPDLIIIYMGINDMMTSDRADFLDNPVVDVKAAMQTWKQKMDTKLEAYKRNPVIDVDGGNMPYDNWQEAYALGLMLMQETYPNAEIWAMSLVDNHAHSSGKNGNINHGNLYIRAIAECLGVGLIDQQRNGYITKENAYLYGQDEGTGIYALHPNVKGHDLMMRLIIDELYKKLS